MLFRSPGPSLIVIDDAQHLDPTSVDALRHITGELAHRPWTVLVAYRPSDGEFDLVARHIDLLPLTDDEARALVGHVLAGSPITSGEVTALVARGGGNPLFLRALAEAARSGERVDALPDTLQGAIASRIDRLAADDRSLLRVAAVLGTSFDQADLLDVAASTGAHVDAAAIDQLTPFLQIDGSGLCSFRDRVVRDTAYDAQIGRAHV